MPACFQSRVKYQCSRVAESPQILAIFSMYTTYCSIYRMIGIRNHDTRLSGKHITCKDGVYQGNFLKDLQIALS